MPFSQRRMSFLLGRMSFLQRRVSFLLGRMPFSQRRVSFLLGRMSFPQRRVSFLLGRMSFSQRRMSFYHFLNFLPMKYSYFLPSLFLYFSEEGKKYQRFDWRKERY